VRLHLRRGGWVAQHYKAPLPAAILGFPLSSRTSSTSGSHRGLRGCSAFADFEGRFLARRDTFLDGCQSNGDSHIFTRRLSLNSGTSNGTEPRFYRCWLARRDLVIQVTFRFLREAMAERAACKTMVALLSLAHGAMRGVTQAVDCETGGPVGRIRLPGELDRLCI
jgi:hypothetical protein